MTAAARRNLDAIRADVREIVTHAAKTGKLPDGSPIAPHTLLEQMAGLEPGARENDATAAQLDRLAAHRGKRGPAGGFYARFVKGGEVALALNDMRAAAVMGLALQKKHTRAAVISARATKRELRAIASAAAASAEVLRAGVNMLAEIKGALCQIYAALDCQIGLLVELRDTNRKATDSIPALLRLGREISRGTPQEPRADLSPLLDPLRDAPKPGDVLTFEDGSTWTVTGVASGAVMVARHAHDTSEVHEKAVLREEWSNAVDLARQIARPGVLAFDRRAPISDAEMRRNIIGAAPVFRSEPEGVKS